MNEEVEEFLKKFEVMHENITSDNVFIVANNAHEKPYRVDFRNLCGMNIN